MSRRFTVGIALLMSGLFALTALHADAKPPKRRVVVKKRWKRPTTKKPVKVTTPAPLATAIAFMNAYMNQDSDTMILKLMTPTKELGLLVKRYQWWRGYGPDELPGAVRPPILFKTLAGSYVPTYYKVLSSTPYTGGKWDVHVQEKGGCKEETGRYDVERKRHIILKLVNGKWYVDDYVMIENPEEYGFWVDDIFDKMIKHK